MLRRILLAGIAATLALAAADFHGTWDGRMVLNHRSARISPALHQEGQSVSGTATIGGSRPAKIENPELAGDRLAFSVRDASGSAVQFRLRAIYGALIGEFLHGGEALAGEAQYGDRIAKVMLPSPSRGTVPPVALRSVPAEYSEEARCAELQATALLFVSIDSSQRCGTARR